MNDRLDFAIVEEYIARRHPDPNHVRADTANHHGIAAAAPHVSTILNVTNRRVLQWRERGVAYYDADEIAIRLGLHPSELWPNWWQLEPPVEDVAVRDYWRVLRAQALEESYRLRDVARTS